jgi:hypothetical protein
MFSMYTIGKIRKCFSDLLLVKKRVLPLSVGGEGKGYSLLEHSLGLVASIKIKLQTGHGGTHL